MQIDIKGRNVPVTDELRAHAERRLSKVARQVSDLARLEIEIFKEPQPARRRLPDRRGHAVPEGRDAARARRLAGDAALAEPDGRRARAPGQAPPRQTAPPARGSRRRAAGRAALPTRARRSCSRRSEQRPAPARGEALPAGRARRGLRPRRRRKLSLAHALSARSRAERRRGEEVQVLPEARGADQRVRGRSSSTTATRSCASGWTRCASARARARSSTRCCRSASRSCARPASARWGCATSTCS